jgi:hypothetical protein
MFDVFTTVTMEIQSCGLRRSVHWWIFANVLEEPGASIFRAEEQKAAGSRETLENFNGNSFGLIS